LRLITFGTGLAGKGDSSPKDDGQNVEQLPEEGKNILLGIIAQLRYTEVVLAFSLSLTVDLGWISPK
jgi:hypothetical protein